MQIGAKIKKLLKLYGWTQPDLADKTGLSQPFISAICCGKRQPSLENILGICDALSITPNDLLLDDNSFCNALIETSLSKDEAALIRKYRLLSGKDQSTVDALVDFLSRQGKGQPSSGSTSGNTTIQKGNLA